MKRMPWWVALGAFGLASLGALVGPTVWGQQEMKIPLPPGLAGLPPALPAPRMEISAQMTEVIPSASLPTAAKVEAAAKQILGGLSFDVPPGKQQPAVSIEWVGPNAIRIHQPMPCQILVRNNSTAPAQNVIVRHRLGQGMVLKSCEPKTVNDNGELIWNLGTLTPEQSRRIELTLIPETRGPASCHATVTFTAVAGHQVQVREPQLTVKMRGADKAIMGETVTLLFAVSNPGDGVAEKVRLKVTLPEGLEHPRGRTLEFDAGTVAPKETRTLQLACVARGTGPQPCMISATGDGNLASSDTGSVDILVPKLDIAMVGPKLRYLYRHAVYVLKVTNPGSAPASNVEVNEVIPAGFKMHQVQGAQYQESTRLVSWKVGDLQPGQTKELAVELIPTQIGEHRLAAQAKTGRGIKSEAEVRTLVEGLPSLEIDVNHVEDPIEVGAETAFEIRVANRGTKPETNIEVVCILPEQLEFVRAKCTTTLHYRQEGREVIFENMPRLAPRAEEIFRVQVKGIAPGDVRFRTRVRADGLKDPVHREDGMRVYSDEMPQRPTTAGGSPPPPMPAPAPAAPAIPPVPPGPILPLPTPMGR